MMEPDVRVETNRLGFCHQHFEQILQRGSRLSVALILESLLDEAGKDILPEDDKLAPKKILAAADRRAHSCFVCENVEKNMQHLSATVIKLWQSEPEFRTLYSRADAHLACRITASFWLLRRKCRVKTFSRLRQKPSALQKTISDTVKADTTHFCRMFDYRNAGGDWGNSRDAIERAITYLTSREPTVTTKTEGKNR